MNLLTYYFWTAIAEVILKIRIPNLDIVIQHQQIPVHTATDHTFKDHMIIFENRLRYFQKTP